MVPFLVMMVMVSGTLATLGFFLQQWRDIQRLQMSRLQAEALVVSAWEWYDLHPDAVLQDMPLPFFPEQVSVSGGVIPLSLPLPGTVYLVKSGNTVWAIGRYDNVMEAQSK